MYSVFVLLSFSAVVFYPKRVHIASISCPGRSRRRNVLSHQGADGGLLHSGHQQELLQAGKRAVGFPVVHDGLGGDAAHPGQDGEFRGIGVIDVKAMYGIGAVALSKSIDLIIELETWDERKSYDRIGIRDQMIEIMGVPVPHQTMPIKPGRNLAIIVEVAARNLSLKRTGYNTAKELTALIQLDNND